MDAPTVDAYFTEFLPAKLHQPLLPRLQKLSAVFSIVLTGQPERMWTLKIAEGILVSVAPGSQDPQCGFRLKPETFVAIVSGDLSPQVAFFKLQVEIEGRIDLGLRLATVLADFFKMFPYRGSAS